MRAFELVTRWMSVSPRSRGSPDPGHSHFIQTSNGAIIGHKATSAPQVIEYLGIPYAKPPIGDLRFAAPVKFKGDAKSTLEASEYSAGCPVAPPNPSKPYPEATDQFGKIIAAFGGSVDKNRSEDCLTLNIWSKKLSGIDKAKKNKPVIIFFYGGRFSISSANTPFYNGQYLADTTDAIVVTLNYRLNVFGFSGAPDIPQNVGLLDQRLAVEWVRDNIQNFGGDPKRIVISGQSSGAVAIDYWSFAYKEEPIVSGFIKTSGTALSFGKNTNELALEHWYNISSLLGCGKSGDTLPCMRAIKNVSAIEEATTKIEPPPSSNPARSSPIFQPTADGVTVFENYTELFQNGNFSRLPTLLGHNDNEAGYYKVPAFSQGTTLSASQWEAFNDGSFTCPIAYTARNRAAAGVPVWRYRYFGDWNNTRLYGPGTGNGNEEGSGAYHGTEIEMILGVSEDVSGLPKSEEQEKMEHLMMGVWAAFAKDSTNGLKEYGWPVYNPNTESLVRLGYENKGEATFVKPDVYDAVCKNVTIMG